MADVNSPRRSPPDPTDPPAGASRSFSLRAVVALLFLGAQAGFVLQTHFSADSPRLLTPVAGLTQYELHATLAGQSLGADDIENRYGLEPRGYSGLTASALELVVEHWEKPIPLSRALVVRLHTREPGLEEGYWLWPQE